MGIVEGCKSAISDCKNSSDMPMLTNYDFSMDEVELDEKGEQIIFNTKLERMIFKLKFLKKRALQYKDKESLKHINWIMNSLHDRDLHEPINRVKIMDKEALDIIGTYSQQHKYSLQVNDAKKVIKAEKIKNIRKSPGYQKFISKFKKKIKSFVNEVNSSLTNTLTEIPKTILEAVKDELNKVDSYEFNIFDLDRLIQKKSLFYVLNHIMNKYGYIKDLLVEKKYISFVHEITSGYNRKIPYHNDMHATDVLQTVHILIDKGNLVNKLNLTDIDVLSCLIAAACHDYKHNGYNNAYHTNVYSDIALNYNDVSVLENMHASESFKIIFKEGSNIFERLSPEQFRIARRRIIECILATDMASHGKKLAEVKAKLTMLEIENGKNLDKLILPESAKDAIIKNNATVQMFLSECVHTADLSNPAKMNTIFIKWTDLVYQEFFAQGDKEKELGMNYSMLCDRNTTNIHKSQVGFISFIVMDQFEVMLNICPEIKVYMDNLKMNLKYCEDKVEQTRKDNVSRI